MSTTEYRLWDEDNKQYIYFNLNNLEDSVEVLAGFLDYFSKDYLTKHPAEQYSGVKDKNRKKIYKGDKLKGFEINGIYGEYIVEFMMGAFVAYHDGTGNIEQLCFIAPCLIEVIGNIHEGEYK